MKQKNNEVTQQGIILNIQEKVRVIRGERVILDSDLAVLYGVPTKRLNEAVKRNAKRFPSDFMFKLNQEEMISNLKSQFATSSYGGRRKPTFAFTEQGIAMLSSVLRSEIATRVNIYIMRVFVQIRKMASTHQELREKIADLGVKYDSQFETVFEAIQQLLIEDENSK